jgi:hypothetical protein
MGQKMFVPSDISIRISHVSIYLTVPLTERNGT